MSWKKQGTGFGVAVALAASFSLGGGSAAVAQSADAEPSPEAAALDSLGVLQEVGGQPSDASSGSYLDAAQGLLIPLSAEQSLRVIPEAAESPTQDPSGLLIYVQDDSFSYALSDADLGATAGYSILFDQDAPTEFRYNMTVGDSDVTLELNDSGGVNVLAADGSVANIVLPPWALDANGAAVPTTYSIDGNVLVQHVEHAGAAYPVVADPTFGCDAIWCTALLTRGENASVANDALNAGILCTVTGVYAPICGAMIGLVWAKANEARNIGKCAGIRWWRINGAFMHPVIESCP